MRARDVPDVRDFLTRLLDSAAGGTSVALRRMFEWEHRVIHDDPRLVWVAPDMVELLVEVASTVPDDVALTEVPMPSLAGLVIYSTPVWGTDGINGSRLRLDGQMWGGIMIGPPALEDPTPGVGIATVVHSGEVAELTPESGNQIEWMTMGRTEWLENEKLGEYSRPDGVQLKAYGITDNPEALKNSAIEDRRLLVALWTLMADVKAAEVGTWESHRKMKRGQRKPPKVLVVRLRREQRQSTGDGERKLEHDHRWWVAPHFRMQAYGPGHSLRRLTFIAGHVKGPDDKPFVRKERVWSLQR